MASGNPSSREQISATAAAVLRGEREVRSDCLGTTPEQGNRLVCLQRRKIRHLCRTGKGERRHRKLTLATNAQRFAAGHQRLDLGPGRQTAPSRLEPRPQQVLEVVEQEQHPPLAEVAMHDVVQERPPPSRSPSAVAIAESTRAGSRRRRQIDEDDAVRVVARPASSPTRRARRVLPVPPGPVSVTRRTSGACRRVLTASISGSRPRNGVNVAGNPRRRSSAAGRVGRSSGKSGCARAKTRSVRSKSRSRTSPRSLKLAPDGQIVLSKLCDRFRQQDLAAVGHPE